MKKYILLFAVLAVAACASDDGDKSADKVKDTPPKKAQFKTDDLICPQVAILREAELQNDYGGEQPDPSQLVALARMKSVEGDCAYRKDGIDILYTLHMTAQRGKRLGGDTVSFPYFVAVVDPSDNILSRQIVSATFHFSDKDKSADDDEALHVFIPLPESGQIAGPDYRVLAGFQKHRN